MSCDDGEINVDDGENKLEQIAAGGEENSG